MTQIPMLTPPAHQVAGHRASSAQLGPLTDSHGRFYKPLQNQDRGSKEVAFYQSFTSNPQIPPHIRNFFPDFYGTQFLESPNDSGFHPHMVIQDLVFNLKNPSVIDIKIGSRTWYPQASEDYIKKCLEKDRDSTSLGLGFRVSGLQVFDDRKLEFWKPEKDWIKGLKRSNEVRSVLRRFVSSNPCENGSEPDCSFASVVYGGILKQLLELKAWFEDQTFYHFYTASVLLIYEKEDVLEGRSGCASVKLIDFPHVVEGDGIIDHNFLGGLCSLIKFVSEIST